MERRYTRGGITVLALHDVDLDITPGEFVSIEGPSGSGKSTLLQLLGALDTPTAGTIRFEANELGSASDRVLTHIRSQEIGFVFQQFNLIPTLTASENVGMAMIPHHVSKADSAPAGRRAARPVSAWAAAWSTCRPGCPAGSSSGWRSPGRSPTSPRVIIADEPTGNLDSESADGVMALLAELRSGEDAVTIVVATHDDDVARHAGRRIRLRDGAIVSTT